MTDVGIFQFFDQGGGLVDLFAVIIIIKNTQLNIQSLDADLEVVVYFCLPGLALLAGHLAFDLRQDVIDP